MPIFYQILEGVEPKFCLHLSTITTKKSLKEWFLMMATAKATYYQAREAKMEKSKKINPDAHNWLVSISTKCWRKNAFSSHPKCDVLMNNLPESFNNIILLARDKPILTMMKWIRTYLMSKRTMSETDETVSHSKISKYRIVIHRLTKEIYTHYLTLAMPSRYRIVPSLAYEYPSLVRYSELSRYSPTW